MEALSGIWIWVQLHWVEVGAALVLVNAGLTTLAELTPWQWDDNIVRVITKTVKSVFPPKKEPTPPA